MKTYVVRPGDTTSSIAAIHNTSIDRLVAANLQKPRVVALVSGRPTQVFATLTPGESLSIATDTGYERGGCNCGK